MNIFLHYYSSFNPPLPAAVFCQSGSSARQLCAPAALGLKVSAAALCIYLIFSLTQCLPPVLPAEFPRHMAPSSAGQHMAAEDTALVWIQEGKGKVDEAPPPTPKPSAFQFLCSPPSSICRQPWRLRTCEHKKTGVGRENDIKLTPLTPHCVASLSPHVTKCVAFWPCVQAHLFFPFFPLKFFFLFLFFFFLKKTREMFFGSSCTHHAVHEYPNKVALPTLICSLAVCS